MAISPLLPAAGVAAGALAVKAAQGLTGGRSFAELFRRADEAQPAPSQSNPPVAASTASTSSAATNDPQKLLRDFQDLVKRRLAAAGIDLSAPIVLKASGEDGVQVDGDRTDWPRIEQIFENDPSLRDAFKQLADAFSRQKSASGERFKLTLSGDQATVAFE